MTEPLAVGIIGLGSMGCFVARQILQGKIPGLRLWAAADIRRPPDDLLQDFRRSSVSWVPSFQDLGAYPLRLAIECANQQVAWECANFFLSRGVDLLIMSVGALLEGTRLTDLSHIAKSHGCQIYVPSGAVGAMDALQAARWQGLEEVTLTTRKPPGSFGRVEGIDLEGLRESRVIFEGPAREAVVRFPQNVNVAATISLAGLGPEKTRVRIIADPNVDRNVHEIFARGVFGTMEIRLSNLPHPENPKTSMLACLSVVSLLKKMQATLKVGS